MAFESRHFESNRWDRIDRPSKPREGNQDQQSFRDRGNSRDFRENHRDPRGREGYRDQDGDRDQGQKSCDRDRDVRDFGRNRFNPRDPGGKDGSRISKGFNANRERPGASEHTITSPSTLTSPQNDSVPDRQISKTAPPTPFIAKPTVASMTTTNTTTTMATSTVTSPTEAWSQIISLLSDRSSHSMMRQNAERAYQKAQQTLETCRQSPNDHGSTLGILEKQKKDTEDGKNKYDRLIRDVDEKLKAVFPLLWPNAGQNTAQNGCINKPLPVNGDSFGGGANLEAKFASMEGSLEKRILEHMEKNMEKNMEKKMEKKMEEGFASMRKKHKAELESQGLRLQMDMTTTIDRYVSQTSELGNKVGSQAMRIDALEERVRQLEEQKARPLEQALSPQTPLQDCALSRTHRATLRQQGDSISFQQQQIEDAEQRIGQVESTISQLITQLQELADKLKESSPPAPALEKFKAEEKQRQEIASLQAQWSKLPVESLLTLPDEVSLNKTEVQGALDKMSAGLTMLETQLDAVRDQQGQQSSTPPAASDQMLDPSIDQRIEQIVKSHVEDVAETKIKKECRQIAAKVGEFIDKRTNEIMALHSGLEARLQTQVEAQAEAQAQAQAQVQRESRTEEELRVLRIAVNERRPDPSLPDDFVEDQLMLNAQSSQTFSKHSQCLINMANDLRLLKQGYDGHQLALHNLSHWQNHFDTRQLYMDMVAHINATVPDNVIRSMNTLTARVTSIEARFTAPDEGTNKRRRLPNGGFMIENGGGGSH